MTVKEKLRAIRQLIIDGKWHQGSLGTPEDRMCIMGMCAYVEGGSTTVGISRELSKILRETSMFPNKPLWVINDLGNMTSEKMVKWVESAMEES